MSPSSVPSPSDSQRLALDAWPVMEWLKDRGRAADYVDLLLARSKQLQVRLFMSRINLGEVYYSTARAWDVTRADFILARMYELPIDMVSASDDAVLSFARLKIVHNISYADVFAAGLAMELRCPLVTGDPEFRALAQSGMIELDWIGA